MEKTALGKGIGAIFSDDAFVDSIKSQETLTHLAISAIKPNRFQPRKTFDDKGLEELTRSIMEKGVLQPVIVRPLKDNFHEIIAGERRWRASRLAGKTTLPVIIKHINENELLELALVENVQRRDLNPVETANGYKQLIDELGFTQEEVAQKVGKDRSSVANFVRLLKLPQEIIDMLSGESISLGHAKILLGVKSSELAIRLAKKVASENIPVRSLEKIITGLEQKNKDSNPVLPQTNEFTDMETQLKRLLQTNVKIVDKGKKGRLIINYASREDLNKIVALFCDNLE